MSLSLYKKKRSFDKTSEPSGGLPKENKLIFVVQKHAASHLHYDFRLEMQGVLKSWAVPKGPSTDTSVKRLAMMVEDHPFDYRNFEGIIPKGQYGGGTVIVWDEGTYEPDDIKSNDKKTQEKELLKELYKGRLKFILHGKKLKGKYALVKSDNRGENAWLLMKLNDKYASSDDITKKEKSIQSGKTILQVEKTSTNIYGKTGPKYLKESIKKQKEKILKEEEENKVDDILNKGKKEKMPENIEPMLATLVDKPFDEEGWLYEVKWDGYRALAFLNNDITEIKSRNNKSFNEKFYPIYDGLKSLNINAVLDGEIIVADKNGVSDFGSLQNWRSEADGTLKFYVFDILWLNGKTLMHLPLIDRREILKEVILSNENILISESFDSSGIQFYEVAEKMHLEGIIAKKKDSTYIPGSRSKDWLKIKTSKRQEVVIGGFTKNEGSKKAFSSLLVGVYQKEKLVYTGKIGTGFDDKKQTELMAFFNPLIINKCLFENEPDINKPSRFRPNPPKAKAFWLRPELVCEVSFREMTRDGVMRHPSFQGLREDKKATQVIQENEVETEQIIDKENILVDKKIITTSSKTERKTLLNPSEETQVKKLQRKEIKFSNLSKIFWPKENITKRDMLNYYYQAAPYILPYVKNRPQSLNRHPNGINGMSFYQKDVTGKVPAWLKTFPYTSEGQQKNYMVCDDEASILYIASLGCIEINPWSSTIEKSDNPDWCIIDLDPDKNHFDQVIETANITKEILDSINVKAFCKTSGSTGIHIYIPLGAKYTYEESKEFGRLIAKVVHAKLPDYTSIERLTANRKGKLYIDFLQNRPKATLATAYSLRPKPGATVSMPLHWEEVKKGLKMTDFNISNAMARVKEQGDIFKGVLGKGINLKAAEKKLQTMIKT